MRTATAATGRQDHNVLRAGLSKQDEEEEEEDEEKGDVVILKKPLSEADSVHRLQRLFKLNRGRHDAMLISTSVRITLFLQAFWNLLVSIRVSSMCIFVGRRARASRASAGVVLVSLEAAVRR